MERRREKRVRCRKMVKIISSSKDHAGIVTDVSKKGLFIQTSWPFKPGELIELQMDSGGKTILAQAQVRWSKQVPHHQRLLSKGGIGVLTVSRKAN